MNELTNREMAAKILEPHLPILNRVMVESLQEVNRAMTVLTESLNNRAISSMLHSLAVKKVQRYFSNNSDIFIKAKYQTIQIVFKSELVGRIKKVKDDKKPTNAHTKRNNDILSHQMKLFEDIASLTYIDLAYKINSTWTEYDWLIILCRQNSNIKWEIDFKGLNTTITMPVKDHDVLTIKTEEQISIKIAK